VSNPTRDINKTFLANTIKSIESHNRREETADCWRQHELQEKVVRGVKRERDLSDRNDDRRRREHLDERDRSERRSARPVARSPERSNENIYQDDRQYWAELKVCSLRSSSLCSSL
jgi:hypothetical protein